MSKCDTNADAELGAESGRTVRQTVDWSTVSPSTAVAELVAEATDSDPAAIGPLYDAIDSDALDALVRHRGGSTDCVVTFPYDGVEVTVSGDGEVLVTVPDTPS